MARKFTPSAALLILFVWVLSACGSATETTDEPPTAPVPTLPPANTPPADTPEQEIALEPGDPERGHDVFLNGGAHEDYKPERVCIRCHSLDGSDGGGPTLQGIAARAGERVPGLSAGEYLHQSILDPDAYVIEGYKAKMGRIFGLLLSEQEMNDLVAFLLTQTPPERGPVPDITAELQKDYAGGDALAGELIAIDRNCRDCHANNLHPGARGPHFPATDELPAILERGDLRLSDPAYEGQAATNEEYLIESILLADAYVVPGDWKVPMQSFHGQLTDAELADILAWLGRFE